MANEFSLINLAIVRFSSIASAVEYGIQIPGETDHFRDQSRIYAIYTKLLKGRRDTCGDIREIIKNLILVIIILSFKFIFAFFAKLTLD